MKNEGKTALAHLTASAEKEFCAFLAQQTPEAYEDAVALIEECRAAGPGVVHPSAFRVPSERERSAPLEPFFSPVPF